MKDIHDVIKLAKFGDDRLRGSGVVAGQISAFPIDFAGRPYNTLTLPCERVMCVYLVPFSRYSQLLSKVADFNPPHLHLVPTQGMAPVECREDFWQQKTRVPGLSCGVVCFILRLSVLVEHRLVTQTQTDTGP